MFLTIFRTNKVSKRCAVVPLVGTLFSLLVTGAVASKDSASHDSSSFSSHELSQFFSTLPADLPIYGIQIHALSGGATQIGLLTTANNDGWQIRIYSHRRTGEFISDWQSPRLAPEFAVSSANNFRSVLGDPEHEVTDIEFSGCKAHDCPGSFGILIYSPSRKRAFQAVVRNGETILSPELNLPENKPLKDYLLKRVEYMSHYHE